MTNHFIGMLLRLQGMLLCQQESALTCQNRLFLTQSERFQMAQSVYKRRRDAGPAFAIFFSDYLRRTEVQLALGQRRRRTQPRCGDAATIRLPGQVSRVSCVVY